MPTAISRPNVRKPGFVAGCSRFVMGCCGVFCGIGGLVFFLTVSLPHLREALDSLSWNPTPCTILRNSVITTQDSEGDDIYSISVEYSYEIGGKSYSSTRYDFMGGASSGYARKKDFVDRNPPGASATCFVNPMDPEKAVMNKDPFWPIVVSVIPLSLFLFGFLMLLKPFFAPTPPPLEPERPYLPPPLSKFPGPIPLKTDNSLWAKILGFGIGSFFFIAIVASLVPTILSDFRSGTFDWVVILFSLLVAFAGIAVVGWFVYYLLCLWNPRPVLVLKKREIRPGDTIEVGWKVYGSSSMIRVLEIGLLADEFATYTRGTDSVTDDSRISSFTIARVEDARTIAAGQAAFRLPRNVMHSFDAPNNKVSWKLTFHGDIPNWPDVVEEYPIVVYPAIPGGQDS